MPRLLAVVPRFLFPLDQGGKIRTANVLKHMKGGKFDITLASPAPLDLAPYRPEVDGICDRFVAWPESGPSKVRQVLALADRVPASAAADRSKEGCRVVAGALAGGADVVLVDFPHASTLLPDRLDAASVIFTHNVEAEIFERHARVARGLWRPVWRDQARKMSAFEGEALRRFDSVIAVSSRDADALASRYGLDRVEVIDTGVDLDYYAFAPPGAAADTLVFTGSMDWKANVDGIGFLRDEVWPLVAARRPDARAIIVGRNPPGALVESARGLPWTFTGFVDDVRPLVREGHVYVIPLRVGSGTRIKAFEAMAMGVPVVSTGLGVEGLDITPNEHYLAADTPGDFAAAILRLLGDAPLRATLARAARARVEDRFSWDRVARQFEAICLRALERRSGRAIASRSRD